MATRPVDAFERTFPQREWYAGLGRNALFWSILNGLLVALFLLEIGLVCGLFVDRGVLAVIFTDEEARRFKEFTGHSIAPVEATEDNGPADGLTSKELPANSKKSPEVPPATAPSEKSEAAAPSATGSSTAPASSAEPSAPAETSPATANPALMNLPDVDASDLHQHRFEDQGILPSVWRARDSWWGPMLASIYRRTPMLQQNIAALMVLLLVTGLTWILRMWCMAHLRGTCRSASLEVATRLRRQLHRQSMRLATEDLDGRGLTEAISLFQTDVDRVRRGLFVWLYRKSRYPVELGFLVLTAFSIEALLATQWVLLSVLGWYLIQRSQRVADRTRLLAMDRADRELGSLAESLRVAKLIRGYGIEIAEQNQFQDRLKRYLDAVTVQNRVQDDPLWLRLMVSLACVALMSFLLFVLGAKTLSGEVTPPGAVVFLAAFAAGILAVRELQRVPADRAEVAVAADNVWRYLDRLPTVSQAVGARFIQPLSKSLHVVGVSYQQPDGNKLLEQVDLKLVAGRTYAVVSLDDQSAKAFVSLLPRFIEPGTGRILFDGEDIAWGTLESIRAETLFVSANDALLPGSLLENIRAGHREVTLTQATEAAKEARAHNFISRLSAGYETQIDSQEASLDAGQRLRISMARALLRKPSILIIEEPDEELSEDAKQLLDDTYDRICPARTVFFLPTRLSTLRRSDEILVFRNGRIEAMGPHSLLVKESPLYRHWEYVHFNEFRHADS